jgi:hypothetical protein
MRQAWMTPKGVIGSRFLFLLVFIGNNSKSSDHQAEVALREGGGGAPVRWGGWGVGGGGGMRQLSWVAHDVNFSI